MNHDGHGQGPHLDADVLAEFRAELVTGRRARSISAHLADCARCAAVDEQLAQVSVLLAAVPAPAVPDAVARRLDRVLAAEAQEAARSERTSVLSPGSRHSPSRLGVLLRQVFQVRVLAPAAGVLAVLAGAGFGLSQLGSSTSSMSASSGAGNLSARGTPGAASGSSAERAIPAGGSGSMSPNRRAEPAATGGVVDVVKSGVNYQHATLRQQLTAQLAMRTALRLEPASAAVRGCVLRLSGNMPRVLVESAFYRGAPATIVVVSGPHGYQALVAGSRCSDTNSDLLDSTVLSPGISTP